MRPLPFRVGMGNLGTGLAQPKAPPSEQALALAHRQVNVEVLLDPATQCLPIPQRARQAQVTRCTAQRLIDLLQLRLAQTSRTPRTLSFAQPRQPLGLEAPNPVFYRTWSVSQQSADFRTGHALRYQQHPMEAVIIARFFRTSNLVLKSHNHCFGISNLQWSHASMKPQVVVMRNYLGR
jgi:hypothetical protein